MQKASCLFFLVTIFWLNTVYSGGLSTPPPCRKAPGPAHEVEVQIKDYLKDTGKKLTAFYSQKTIDEVNSYHESSRDPISGEEHLLSRSFITAKVLRACGGNAPEIEAPLYLKISFTLLRKWQSQKVEDYLFYDDIVVTHKGNKIRYESESADVYFEIDVSLAKKSDLARYWLNAKGVVSRFYLKDTLKGKLVEIPIEEEWYNETTESSWPKL